MGMDKSERAKIKSNIRRKKDERDKKTKEKEGYERDREELQQQNKKLTEEKNKCQTIINQSNSAIKFLNLAKSDIDNSKDTYKANLSGNAGDAKISSFASINAMIDLISSDISSIGEEAQKLFNTHTLTINDNIKIIGTLNDNISQRKKDIEKLDAEIRHLEGKL